MECMREVARAWAAHRPQRAGHAPQPRVVHRKRKPRLAAACRSNDHGARAQRVVKVGRVHLRALVRRARAQPRQRTNSAAPRVHERAVRRAVLQADRVEAVVQRAHVGGARGHTQRLVVDAMPAWRVDGKRPRAVHWRVLGFRTLLAAAHLEAPVGHRAFNEQFLLDGKRHQEVHAL